MFSIRRIRSLAITAAVAMLSEGVAARAAEPQVTYTATGTFATPPLRGMDGYELAGEPFTITVVVSEGTKPIRHSETSATYNVAGTVVFTSLVDGGFPHTYVFNGGELSLVVGAAGQPDLVQITFPFTITVYTVTFTGRVRMPNGTITTRAIRPFTAPVTLARGDAGMTYTCTAGACGPYTSTTLAISSGTLTATAN